MKKYGVQITVTEPNDNAYCVYQLAQDPKRNEYTRLGPVIWIDRTSPNANDLLLDAIQMALSGKINATKTLK